MNIPLSVLDVFEFQALEGNNADGDPVAITYTSEKRESFTVEVSKYGVSLLTTNMTLDTEDMVGLEAAIHKLYPDLTSKMVRDFFFEFEKSNYAEVGAVEYFDILGRRFSDPSSADASTARYKREQKRLKKINDVFNDAEAANCEMQFEFNLSG